MPGEIHFNRRGKIYLNHKVYSCFPTNFVRFHFGDNDFYWALRNSIPVLLERLTHGWNTPPAYTNDIEFVHDSAVIVFAAFVQIQHVGAVIEKRLNLDINVNPKHYSDLTVEYLDEMDDRSNENGDTVWLDCHSGELY